MQLNEYNIRTLNLFIKTSPSIIYDYVLREMLLSFKLLPFILGYSADLMLSS